MQKWTTEYRWETEDYFFRVYQTNDGLWEWWAYYADGGFIEDDITSGTASGSGYKNHEIAQDAAEEWYEQFMAGELPF